MSFLREFIELITTPPGDLVYHLVTVFAIQVMLGIAFGHWNRNRRDPDAIRLLVAGLGFFLARTLLMLVAVLARADVVSSTVVVPPLERLLDFAILLLVAWAFVPLLKRYTGLSTTILVISLLIALSAYAAFAFYFWPQDEAKGVVYNVYWQDTVWEFASLVVIVAALVAGAIVRTGDWWFVQCLFGLWLAGHALQFIAPITDSHTAGWVRLSNLAALPVATSIVYRHALRAPLVSGMARHPGGWEIIGILEAIQQLETAQEVETALKTAVSPLARALGADMVAIGISLPAPPHLAPETSENSLQSGLTKKIRIVALHPSTGAMLAHHEPALLISRYPLLSAAVQTGRLQRSTTPLRDSALVKLYRELGFEQPGPLLVQPLVDDGVRLGVMLAGNPNTQREWTVGDEQVFQAVGAIIAASLVASSRRETADRSDDLQEALAQAERLARRAAGLEAELKRQRQRTEELSTKLRLREQDALAQDQAPAEAALWQEEIHNLAEARSALETELAEWKERAEQLARSESHLQDQLAQVQAELQAAQQKIEQQGESSVWKERAEQLARAYARLQNQLAQAQARLQEARQEPSISFERLTDGLAGILISDNEGHIILASQGARNLIGRFRSTLEGTPLESLFDEPSWAEAVHRLLYEETEDGDSATVTLDLEGQIMRAELTRIPTIAGGVGTLAVMFYPEEEATVQSEVVVSLIHELRTPMTSITGYTDLLLGESVGILGETQRQFLQRIQANIERMRGLLEDMVKATTVDNSQFSFSPEPVDLVSVIEDAIMALSDQFRKRQLTVQLDMPTKLPPVQADRDSLYQIVLHLLSNACQCSKPDTEVMVRSRLEDCGDQIEDVPDYLFVSVADTGGGISPEDQRKVFQRLYRANNPLIAGVGDTGVGLSIAKALVEAQGGRIWVESEMGVGSTFSFILPLSPAGAGDAPPECA